MIIMGLYTNDGLRREINWGAIYCRPEYGVKSGERVTISFTADIND
jgi:hypothetical protein